MRPFLAMMLCELLALGTLAAVAQAGAFDTPVSRDAFDPAAYAEWVDGAERPRTDSPESVVWVPKGALANNGVRFGDSKAPGPRHLRVGLKSPVPVGSVLVRANAGVQLSVLKAGAKYPGDLAADADWTSAQRRGDGGDLALWVLPPGTVAQALRLTCQAAPSANEYGGWVGGVYVLAERFANVAPQATPVAGANPQAVPRLTDGRQGSWADVWDNGKEGGPVAVTPQRPEWVMLVWPAAVPLRGLCALWAGFAEAQVQVYAGPADRHPREAADDQWRTVKTAAADCQYPRALGPNWIDLGETLATRAVRLRITQPVDEKRAHPHVKGNIKDGKRVWLGELMALAPLGDGPLDAATAPLKTAAVAAPTPHPPIPIRFTLQEPGYVTLVIDDADGRRVRNLVSETPLPAGENIAWWDGLDDLGRDNGAAAHGVYHIPGALVKPGTYRVRGLTRRAVDLRYEMTVYNLGVPPWPTRDHAGGWLADHTAPSAVLFVPGDRPRILVGSYVAEGGDGVAILDLEGRKLGGFHWLGGTWTGASHLARDAGERAVPGLYAYTGAGWSNDQDKTQGQVRLMALTDAGEREVLKYAVAPQARTAKGDARAKLAGLAVHNGLLVAALPDTGELLFVTVAAPADAAGPAAPGGRPAAGKPAGPMGNVLGTAPLPGPGGLAFDRQGRLLVLVGKQLERFALGASPLPLPAPQILVADGLEDPQQIALDDAGNLYVSDRGSSHQVKVFTPDGKPLRTIGTPGAPKAGPYDPNHMNNPAGLTIAADGRLWVAESDFQPKRVSVWTLDGKLVRAFYGPPEYGGGGQLDPRDKTRFYYHGMEFRLDWDRGTNQLVSVFYRPGKDDVRADGHHQDGPPQTALYVGGRQYFTNCFNCNPTGGSSVVLVWLMRDGLAVPVAAFGQADRWDRLKADEFRPRLPPGANLVEQKGRQITPLTFAWSDTSGDGRMQPEEVAFAPGASGSVTVMPDLSVVTAYGLRCDPQGFTAQGAPQYDLAKAVTVATDTQRPTSSGGGQALLGRDGWLILSTAPKPFAPQSVGGVREGKALWSYPSPWPGLHASHSAPLPTEPGQLIGTTRLLGYAVTPRGGGAPAACADGSPAAGGGPGEVWAINGNKGNVYLFTTDGLFVATLFKDCRTTSWSMPAAVRGMSLNDTTIHEEDFWPTVTQTADGAVYLVVGVHTTCTIVRVDGLDTIRRLPDAALAVTAGQLAAAQQYFVERDAARVAREGRGTLAVALRAAPPKVDGDLADWAGADWATIDQRITKVGDWGSKPDVTTAAVAVAGDRLYAAFQTNDPSLLRNSGESLPMLFKTGGCLDLMIGADPAADPKRRDPAAGDLRLLVTLVKGKPVVVLYRPVVPGTKEPVPFSSPWRTVKIDAVDDVTSQVQFAAGKEGQYEMSIPLAALGLKPKAGQGVQGDIGILRGDGMQTLQRVYWQNKATGITSDVPSEAALTPALWGRWQFKAE
jgi:hypothetical protein